MIVLDASAAIEIVLNSPTGRMVSRKISQSGQSFHAPQLLDIEVSQVLRKLLRTKQMGLQRAEASLSAFRQLGITRYDHEPLVPRIWQLKDALSAYDAAYVTLSEALGVPLLTCDRKLEKAAGHLVPVEVVLPTQYA